MPSPDSTSQETTSHYKGGAKHGNRRRVIFHRMHGSPNGFANTGNVLADSKATDNKLTGTSTIKSRGDQQLAQSPQMHPERALSSRYVTDRPQKNDHT